ncbi:hypothetical protein B0H21DRAFT_119329 [Amylocystis lapponica]|nr:hypothetical protein B0H21DRAFT_426543 [Amylocystis lapponica]KAH9949536.1 hypothetical protein B0H21DRAFT_119329 [Amylocystis lapponica]
MSSMTTIKQPVFVQWFLPLALQMRLDACGLHRNLVARLSRPHMRISSAASKPLEREIFAVTYAESSRRNDAIAVPQGQF